MKLIRCEIMAALIRFLVQRRVQRIRIGTAGSKEFLRHPVMQRTMSAGGEKTDEWPRGFNMPITKCEQQLGLQLSLLYGRC